MSEYYGRFSHDGRLIGAGKFFGGTLGLYGRDGQFHYDASQEKAYYEGEYDEITDEEFEEFKAMRDAYRAAREERENDRGESGSGKEK